MRILRLTVTPDLAGCSVGRLLRQEMHLSSSLLKSLKWRENAILLNGHPVTVRAAVKPGDILTADISDVSPVSGTIVPVNYPLDIL